MPQLVYQLAGSLTITAILIDRYNSTGTATAFQGKNLPVVLHGRGMVSMAPTCKAAERAVLGGHHPPRWQPVLRWSVANAKVKTNEHDNKKLVKIDPKHRINGAVCLVMAAGTAMARPSRNRSMSLRTRNPCWPGTLRPLPKRLRNGACLIDQQATQFALIAV